MLHLFDVSGSYGPGVTYLKVDDEAGTAWLMYVDGRACIGWPAAKENARFYQTIEENVANGKWKRISLDEVPSIMRG